MDENQKINTADFLALKTSLIMNWVDDNN
jgi:hypothetical protein